MPEFKQILPNEDKYGSELALRLIGFDREGMPCSFGTAFVLRPHLLVTARHVIEEFVKRAKPNGAPGHFKFTFWSVQIEWKAEQAQYNIWQVVKVYISPHTDICLLHIRAENNTAEEYTSWKATKVTLEPPSVGEEVIGYGFYSTSFEGTRIHPNKRIDQLIVNDQISMSIGHVKQIHMQGRDAVMLPFPCFEVDCRFEPGMSGGIIVNSDSELIGIICSSMILGEEHFSHVAMLWPIMGIMVDFGHKGRQPWGIGPLSKLADYGIWRPRGWERVRVEEQPDTPITKVTYIG